MSWVALSISTPVDRIFALISRILYRCQRGRTSHHEKISSTARLLGREQPERVTISTCPFWFMRYLTLVAAKASLPFGYLPLVGELTGSATCGGMSKLEVELLLTRVTGGTAQNRFEILLLLLVTAPASAGNHRFRYPSRKAT